MARNYTHTSNPVQDSLGRSSLIRAEFALIDTGLTATDAEIDSLDLLKAPKASPTFTGTVTLPAGTSIGNVSAAEVAFLDGVTSAIQTQIDAKAAKGGDTYTGTHNFDGAAIVSSQLTGEFALKATLAGDTYSGTHDYTGADVTVKTASSGAAGSAAASLDFVNGVAFSTVLPGQGDAADYSILRTIGDTATWSENVAQLDSFVVLTSGTSWTCPEGVRKIKAYLVSGGDGGVIGGGGGFVSGKDGGSMGAVVVAVTSGESYTCAIGAGGSGAAGGASTLQVGDLTYSSKSTDNGVVILPGNIGLPSFSDPSATFPGGPGHFGYGKGANGLYSVGGATTTGQQGAIILELHK